jgi:Domain of unknown function (DUF397).
MEKGLARQSWRKSSYSADNGAACVEVTGGIPGMVAVRDSKDPDGPILTFTHAEWRAFLKELKTKA